MGELGQVPDDMWSMWGLLCTHIFREDALISQESHFS